MHHLAKTFYKLFNGRRDTYAVQKKKKDGEIAYFRIAGKELNEEVFSQHLSGEEVVGVYPLLPGGVCLFAAVDVDTPDIQIAKHAQKALPQPNYLERSRSGNHHIWMFFKTEVSAKSLEKLCRETIICIKNEVGCHCNLYPLPTTKGLGVLIALPHQGSIIADGSSSFLDENDVPIEPEQIETFLKNIKYTKLKSSKEVSAKKLYLNEGKNSGDRSRSGYDFSLAQLLLKRCIPTDLAQDVLLNKPEGTIHATDDTYLKRTLTEADRIKPHTVDVRDWSDVTPCNRKEFLETLSSKLIIGDSQRQQLDVFYGTLVANLKTSGRPVWLLLIGPPGCGKTMPMLGIQHSPFVYACSSFRPTALISGWGTKGGQDSSMLPKLQGKILMVKDMSSLMSQHNEVVNEIMGLLRDAYDGSCARTYGTGVERRYECKFGFIGAATPDIDSQWSLNVRLGERFLRYRVKSTLDQVYGKIDLTLDNIKNETEVDNIIEDTSLGYLKYLTREDADLPHLMMRKEIGRLAQLGAILRTSVARHAYSRQILVIPEWEEATRYAKQLAKLALGLAFIRDKSENDEEEMRDLKAVVLSGIDAKIEKLCCALYKKPSSTTHQLGVAMGVPAGMVRMWLEDLNIARIVVCTRQAYEMYWDFVPLIAGMLKHFKLW